MFKIQKTIPIMNINLYVCLAELIKQVQTLADANNLSFNKVVIQCIEYALNNMENTK